MGQGQIENWDCLPDLPLWGAAPARAATSSLFFTVIVLNAVSVVMTTYYQSLGKACLQGGCQAISSSITGPHLCRSQLVPLPPPFPFGLSERSLLFSKFPEYFCDFCVLCFTLCLWSPFHSSSSLPSPSFISSPSPLFFPLP